MPEHHATDQPSRRRLVTARRWQLGLAALLGLVTIGVMTTAILGSSIQSGVRAYVGGEGSWSKAQKDAVLHLGRYLETGVEADWQAYRVGIAVTLGDRHARLELERSEPDTTIVTEGFLAGGIAPEDIPSMAMVFRTFRHVSYIDGAITVWTAADAEIDRLDAIASEIRAGVLDDNRVELGRLSDEVNAVNGRLTALEDDFSATLGEGARWVQSVLLVVMASILLVLVAVSILLGRFMVGKLRAADLRGAEELRTSETRLRFLVDHLPAIAWTTDLDFVLTSLTGDGLVRLGIDASDYIGRTMTGPFGSEADGAFDDGTAARAAHDAAALRGESGSYRITIGRRVLQAHVEPLWVAGRIIGVIGVGLDLTDRLEMEARLEQATRLESIGRLAGGVAHDFNNLLTAITGYADLLAASLPPGEQLHDAEEIQRAAQRATSLTGQLLAFGRRTELRLQLVQPNDVIAQMRAMLGRVLGDDVMLEINLEPGLPPVIADPGQLEQVLLNLAVNARDAMPDGGRLTIETALVGAGDVVDGSEDRAGQAVRSGPTSPRVALRVRDTGTGMDEATRARMFEPFFTTKSRGKGTGLGLSTVHGIVEQTGGTIEVETTLRAGTTFTIELAAATSGDLATVSAVRVDREAVADPPIDAVPGLPMDAVARAEPPAAATAGPAPLGDSGDGPLILVAEDEPSVRHLVVQVLEAAGYRVVSAPDGREALRLADRLPVIDGLVSDVIMPNVNGPQLAAALRVSRPDLPVLFMSGFTGDALDARGPIGDDVDLLRKPFSTDELVARVQAMLSARSPAFLPRPGAQTAVDESKAVA